MCRNIKPLFNFEPPVTEEEIREASLQFVRKVSGFRHPSQANERIFDQAVGDVMRDIRNLLDNLTTTAKPRDREIEAGRLRERAMKRFGHK